MRGIHGYLDAMSIPHQIVGDPVMFDVVFTRAPVDDYRGALRGDAERSKSFNFHLRNTNVLKLDSKFYISLALTEDDLSLTLNAVSDAARHIVDV